MPDPNNIILPEHKLAFMLIPKCANTSIKYAILDALGINTKENIHNPKLFKYADRCFIKSKKDWLKIAIVRNPYDRLLSCWRSKIWEPRRLHSGFTKYKVFYHKMPFEKFIDRVIELPDCIADQHFRMQSLELLSGGKLVPNLIGRMENLDNDWSKIQNAVFEHCKLKLPVLKLINATDKNNNPYTRELKMRVYDKYATDFIEFGYVA